MGDSENWANSNGEDYLGDESNNASGIENSSNLSNSSNSENERNEADKNSECGDNVSSGNIDELGIDQNERNEADKNSECGDTVSSGNIDELGIDQNHGSNRNSEITEGDFSVTNNYSGDKSDNVLSDSGNVANCEGFTENTGGSGDGPKIDCPNNQRKKQIYRNYGNSKKFVGGNYDNVGKNNFNSDKGGGKFRPIGEVFNEAHYFVVHMRGLPYTSFENDVFKFFNPIRPTFVNINFNGKGRHSGTADAFFDTYEDSQLALKRDLNQMGQRYIELFYDGKVKGRINKKRNKLWNNGGCANGNSYGGGGKSRNANMGKNHNFNNNYGGGESKENCTFTRRV